MKTSENIRGPYDPEPADEEGVQMEYTSDCWYSQTIGT